MPRRLTFPVVPPGPHRELLLFLHELHRLAGQPSTRAIADGISGIADPPVRCSHTTVHKVLAGHQLPTNGDLLFEIAKWLNGRNRHTPRDEEALLDRLEELWRAAQRYQALAAVDLHGTPRVFISYAHESQDHRDAVVQLATVLRRSGIDARLDQWAEGVRRDWSRWTVEQILTADFVLIIASPAYRVVGDGGTASSTERGAAFETRTLRELIHANPALHSRRVLPVVLPGRSVNDIPLFLLPQVADHYTVADFSAAGIEGLLRVITGQAAFVHPAEPIPQIATPAPARQLVPAPSTPAPQLHPDQHASPPRRMDARTIASVAPQERSLLLPDLGTSWAVLAGVAQSGDETLPELPQARADVSELSTLLTKAAPDAAFRPNHTANLIDPYRSQLLDAVAYASENAEDTLLFYFSGHGLVSQRRGELLLAMSDTRTSADYTAVPFDSIRDLISDSRARRSVVILDCCYSGRALKGHLGGLGEIPGTYVLTASSNYGAAFATPESKCTAFTGALVDILRNGETGDSEYLTMDQIYRGIRARALQQGFPVPQQAMRGSRELALARNPAFQPSLT